jgi:leader peptidase (prepilin peptidase) / N-methyltransferase
MNFTSCLLFFVLNLLYCLLLEELAQKILNNSYSFFQLHLCPWCGTKTVWYKKYSISFFSKRSTCLFPLTITFLTFLNALLLTFLYGMHTSMYTPSYIFFFSTLIITIYTDVYYMLVSRFVTLFLIPLSFTLSFFNFIPITIIDSLLGASIGYSILFLINIFFAHIFKKNGIGEGDFDLLAYIGSYTGIVGCWISLLLGSFTGSLVGIAYLILYKKKSSTTALPFAPFLAYGAMIFLLFQNSFFKVLTLLSR